MQGRYRRLLILNLDYTEQTGYPGRRIKLNPGKYDVICEWHDQLLTYAANDIITSIGGRIAGRKSGNYVQGI